MFLSEGHTTKAPEMTTLFALQLVGFDTIFKGNFSNLLTSFISRWKIIMKYQIPFKHGNLMFLQYVFSKY